MISVSRVAGYDLVGGAPHSIVVYGVAAGVSGFDVKLTWSGGETLPVPAVLQGGAWTALFRAGTEYGPGRITCGLAVSVDVPDKDLVPQLVRCSAEPVCPKFDDIHAADIIIGQCDAQSLRGVSVAVGITPQTEIFDGHVDAYSIETGNAVSADLTWPPGAATATASLRLAAGPYLLQPVIDQPMKCFGPTKVFDAPACECPVPVFATPTVTDLADGRKAVTGTVEVRVAPSTTVSATLRIVRDAAPYTDMVAELAHADQRGMTFTLTGTANGVAAGTYRLALVIDEPATCAAAISEPFTIEVSVPTPTCPTVELRDPVVEPASGACIDGKRKVSAHADVGAGSGPVDARLELRGGGNTALLALATNRSAPFVLEGAADVVPGTYTVAVVISKPEGCKGADKPVTVAACDTGGGGGNGGGTFRIPWCEILLAGALLLLIVGGVLLSVALCLSVYVAEIVSALVALSIVSAGSSDVAAVVIVVILIIMAIAGLVLMFIGEVLFFLWLFICGSCRANCGMLLNAIWITAFLAAIWFIIAGIAAVISSFGNICFIGPLISAMNMAFLHLCLLYYAAAVGCIGWAPIIPRWMRLRIPDFMKSICKD